MPRSFRAAAIPRNDVIPDCLISPIIGIRSAARALARLTSSALPAARAFADSLAPRSRSSFLPRAFAAARAALVREEISSVECHFMPKSGNSSNSPQLPGSRAGTEFKRARLQQAQASAGKAAQAAQAQIGLGEKMHGTEHIARREREILAHLWLDVLRLAHKTHLPDVRFGSAVRLMLIGFAVLLAERDGKPVGAARLARYLGLPRATLERRLAMLVQRGSVIRQGRGYVIRRDAINTSDKLEAHDRIVRRHMLAAEELSKIRAHKGKEMERFQSTENGEVVTRK